MTHPIPDEMVKNMALSMRAIYDKGLEDRLKQVVEALNQCKEEKGTCVEVLYLFHQKLEAMRPTTTTTTETP